MTSRSDAKRATPSGDGPPRTAIDRTQRRRFVITFAGLVMAMLLASLSQVVLATALPTMAGDLGGAHDMSWALTVYLLAATSTMPIYGKLGDLVGRKPLLLGAIAAFLAGAVTCGLAQSMGWLIVGRLVQGLGGGGLIVLPQTVVASLVPIRERGRYLGYLATVFAVSSVAGPLLGGWFTQSIGWRWAFWFNIPAGCLTLLIVARYLRLPPGYSERRPRLDVAGMVLLAGAVTSLVMATTLGGDGPWLSPPRAALLLGASILIGLFILAESRASEPIIGLGLFADANFTIATVASLMTGLAMLGTWAYLPTYLQMATGAGAAGAGMRLVPLMGSYVLVSVVAGQWVSATGRYKALPIIGSVLTAFSLILLSQVELVTPPWQISCIIAATGAGLGMTVQTVMLIAQNAVRPRDLGMAMAAINFFRQVGSSLGTAVVGTLFGIRLASGFAKNEVAAEVGNSLTPEAVLALPGPARETVVRLYNHALLPIYVGIAPLLLLAGLLLCFVRARPLSNVLDTESADPSSLP